MPRIRTIKPEFPQSETVGRLSRDARLLFIQLWTVCDDEGRTRASSRILASLLYPFDADAFKLMDKWIEELERESCVRRYQVEGNTYLQILNWLKHQKIDRPSKSYIPPFDEPSRAFDEPSRAFDEDHRGSDADLVPSTYDLVPSTKTSRVNAEVFVLPSWIDPGTWDAFLEIRKGKRAKSSFRALTAIVRELEKFRSRGHDPTEVLEKSIRSGWTDVYEPKNTGGFNGKPTRTNGAKQYLESLLDHQGTQPAVDSPRDDGRLIP